MESGGAHELMQAMRLCRRWRSVANLVMVGALLASALVFFIAMSIGIHEKTPGVASVVAMQRAGTIDQPKASILIAELVQAHASSSSIRSGALLLAASAMFTLGLGAIALNWIVASIESRISAHAKSCTHCELSKATA